MYVCTGTWPALFMMWFYVFVNYHRRNSRVNAMQWVGEPTVYIDVYAHMHGIDIIQLSVLSVEIMTYQWYTCSCSDVK